MLINESIWIKNVLEFVNLEPDSVVLNFGSQTQNYSNNNLHILNNVIIPIEKTYVIKNLDLQAGPGIDFTGNILEYDFFLRMKSEKFDLVLLNNVLEHVTNIELICERISELVKKDGYIIFTGPYKYPLHFDPIDNGFRPEVEDVLKLLPKFRLIKGDLVQDYSYLYYLMHNPKLFLKTIVRLMLPFYNYNKWRTVVIPKFKWIDKKFEATCLLLKKEENS